MATTSMKEKLEGLGLTVWGEALGKPRIYVNSSHLKEVFGLDIAYYKSGSISHAELQGEKISNSSARKLVSEKIYFDLITNKFVGTTLTTIL